jgi:hypothetical protein
VNVKGVLVRPRLAEELQAAGSGSVEVEVVVVVVVYRGDHCISGIETEIKSWRKGGLLSR